jgi:hypothetical protein
MGDEVRVNNNLYSWGSIKLKVAGELFHGFTSVSYADKRERVKAYGMGRHHAPRGRSNGKYSTDPVKLAGPKSTMQALRASLAALAPDRRSYGDVEFMIVVQYVEPGENPLHVEIGRCVLTGNTTTDEENADPKSEEVEIDCMWITRNGLTLFDSSQGSPA